MNVGGGGLLSNLTLECVLYNDISSMYMYKSCNRSFYIVLLFTPLQEAQGPINELEKKVKELAMAQAVTEATLKSTKDEITAEKKSQKALTKALDEDKALLESKRKEVEARQDAYQELQERSQGAEKTIQAAQQHFQAVTAGLSSNADGQEETLAAQKIGESFLNQTLYSVFIEGW